MVAFAEENGHESWFQLKIILDQGHTMSGLYLYSEEVHISK
jgi:hypothetical protein